MQIINFSDDACKLWQFLCQPCSVQFAYSADALWWFKAICAFWERKSESLRRFTRAVHNITPHRNFSNYFVRYLKNKYALYLTFSIIIILPMPDRDWDGAAAWHAKPLTAGAWDWFMRKASRSPLTPKYTEINNASIANSRPIVCPEEAYR